MPQQFFPSSDRLEVLIDMRLPEGSQLRQQPPPQVDADGGPGRPPEPGVVSYAAYTGTGTPRFFLAFSPELDQPNYAQFVINMNDHPRP